MCPHSHKMGFFLGLPVPIWADIIFPFLGIRSSVLLRLLNKYSLHHFPHLVEQYTTHCTQEILTLQTLPLLTTFQSEYERLSTEAFDYLETHIRRIDIAELKCMPAPPVKILEIMRVIAMLLTGESHDDPRTSFRQHCFELNRLKSLKRISDKPLFWSFLDNHTETDFNNMTRGCVTFHAYLQMLSKAVRLQTSEVTQIEAQLHYLQSEQRLCLSITPT